MVIPKEIREQIGRRAIVGRDPRDLQPARGV